MFFLLSREAGSVYVSPTPTDPPAVTLRPLRRLALLSAAFITAVLSCGREPTGPGGPGTPAARYARGLSFRPVFPEILTQAGGASGLVAFNRVRIVLRHADGSVALDTVVNFPAGADSVTVSLTVRLLPSAPASGEPLSMNLGYVNAAGDTVFKGGPVTVNAVPAAPGAPAPPPVQIPVSYTGPGASAARVVASPRTLTVLEGDGFTFTAVALDAGGTTLPGTPIIWTSLEPAIAAITTPGSGSGTAQSVRGTARILAQLLTGPRDTVTVQVLLRARNLAAQSGSGQSGTVGQALAQPLVAKVSASDGVGVAGVAVAFAPTSGGGTVGSASVTTDAGGLAQTTWTLGSTVGAQTVTASAAGLTGSPATFSANGIAAVPARLVVTTQPVSTTAGATLAAVVFTAKDALNNTTTAFTGPVTVALGANPALATLGGTTTVNAVAGVATFSTLSVNRVGTGYTFVGSSPGLISATTTTFDIAAGPGRRLEFGAYPVAGAIAGVTIDPITVLARDTTGNLATGFTGVVTLGLGASPTGAVISGRTTATAVNGVATFDSVRLTQAGSYRFTASATGLTGATGPAFDLGAGAAAALALLSGGAQTAAGGTPLALPILVQVKDAFGNAVLGAGRTVTFAASSGGSAAPPSATTNASGQASTTWTLGGVAGAHSLTASSAGLASLIVGATATAPAGVARTWTGAVSTAWTTAGNWSPSGVPAVADSIVIPVVATMPTIAAPVTIKHLVVAAGATLTNSGSTLTLTGNLDAGTTIAGTGTVTLSGTGSLTGTIASGITTNVAGTYTLGGATSMGSLNVSGSLDLSSQALSVTGPFQTSGAGTITMTNAGAALAVRGNATFAGGNENGKLTAGILTVTGNFTATGATFQATGTHGLLMSDTTSAGGHTLTYTAPVAGQGIRRLTFDGPRAKTVVGDVNVTGSVTVLGASAFVNGPGATVHIGGNLADSTLFPDTLGGWRVANTDMSGTGTVHAASSYVSTNLTVSGGTVQPGSYVQVNGNVTVTGSSAVLDLNAGVIVVNGNFATASGGKLKMVDPLDYDWMEVRGSATFAGGSTVGLLTNGFLEVLGNFTQSGAANSFSPDATHETQVGEESGGSLRAGLAGQRRAAGRPLNAPPTARDRAIARLNSRALPDAARRNLLGGGALPGPRQMSIILPVTVSFANPGFGAAASHFGTMTLGDTVLLASDVFAEGQLYTQCCGNHLVSSASNRLVTSRGAAVSSLEFDNVRWLLLDGSPVSYMNGIAFSNMSPTATQFEVNRSNATDSLPDLWYWTFNTTPTSGLYIKATDADAIARVLAVRLVSPTPPSVSPTQYQAVGGAVVLGWPTAYIFTAASGAWNVGANWLSGSVPPDSVDVVIPSGSTVTLDMYRRVNRLTIQGTGVLAQGANDLDVWGDIVTDTLTGGITCSTGITYQPDGAFFSYLHGRLCRYHSGRLIYASGRITVDSVFHVHDAEFRFNNHKVVTKVAWIGDPVGSSTGSMFTANLGDSLVVTDSVLFRNSSVTTGFLDGTLILSGNFRQSGALVTAYNTHTTVFTGVSSKVTFGNPATSFFRNVTINSGSEMFLQSNALATGTLSHGSGAGTASVSTTTGGTTYLLTVSGLNQSAAQPMALNNVSLKFVDGTANATFDNASFANFPASFAGVMCEVNRSGGPYTFNTLSFTGTLFSSGRYVRASGAANVVLVAPSPLSAAAGALCACAPWFDNISTGTVTWP